MAEAHSFKNPKGKPIKSAQKLMAYNLYLRHAEADTKTRAVKQAAVELGIGQNTIWNIIKEIEGTGTVTSPTKTKNRSTIYESLDELNILAIRQHVHSFYFRNELPTIKKVLNAINNDDLLPNFKRTSLYRILLKIGFKYDKRTRKSVLIEKHEIVLWRRKYLTTIRKYREEGKKIYYLDETWINAGHVKSKVWHDTTVKTARQATVEGLSTGLKDPSGKGKRLIITHIGSETGFVDGGLLVFESKKSGDYHEEMNGLVFMQWIQQVLPTLENNCVIVMDNAPYHSVKSEKLPSLSWKKSDIGEWLRSRQIDFEDHFLKVELFDLVKQYRVSHPITYVVDELVKHSGRVVLRLPPYHCTLNPIELVWANIKNYVAANNKTFKINDVKTLFYEGITQVTSEVWKQCVNHVIEKEENRFWNLDGIVDDVIEQIVFRVNGDSSSDSSDDMDNDNDIMPL